MEFYLSPNLIYFITVIHFTQMMLFVVWLLEMGMRLR